MSDPHSREELEELLRQRAPVSKKSVIRIFGGKSSKTGELFARHEIESESEHGIESLDWYSTGACDFGHFTGGDNEIIGMCEVGGELVCARENCARTCVKGCLCCGRHSTLTKDGDVYCSRHLGLLMGKKLGQGALKVAGAVWKAMRS